MITLQDYFGKFLEQATDEHIQNATQLLAKTEDMLSALRFVGLTFPYNPMTRSLISGTTYGGYRPKNCTIGAPNSSHKLGLAVDIYDPSNTIDDYLLSHSALLAEYGMYIEHPDSTKGWSHWTIKAPRSGKRIFLP